MKGWRRGLLIASPFLLLAVGFYTLVRSPWPAIFGLMMRGHQVTVAYGWRTTGELALTLTCFVAALAISFTIRRDDRGR